MLTRFRFRRDFRVPVRLLSDKPTEKDNKNAKDASKNVEDPDTSNNSVSSTDKIKSLLKVMMEDSKNSSSETNFVSAPFIQRKKKSTEPEKKTEKIEESITRAAGEVAKAIGGDVKQNEAELLSKVLGKINQSPTELSKILSGMKVNRSTESEGDNYAYETRGQQVKRLIGRSKEAAQQSKPLQRRPQRLRQERSSTQATVIDIFSGTPSGIFKKSDTVNYGSVLDTWQNLEKRELSLATAQPPTNYFEKMILWTEQGKVWKFPINNEQGLEEENDIHFSEHVFLDAHLEGWCPTKGPIRHFMELVCTGLSKNPFYTAQEKKDHIMWYKEYFESKKDLLMEVGAWNINKNANKEQVST